MFVRRHHLVAGLLAVTAAGCSNVPYTPRPLDGDAALAAYSARSAHADGLRRFAAANGYAQADWPPRQWGLRELTIAALYFHPDLDVARAHAAVARAQQAGAGARGPLGARVRPEHHGRELEEDDGPWALGLELEIPLTSRDRREAQRERSAFEADAADLDIAAAAWAVRARVRDCVTELHAARQAVALLEAQVETRRELLALVERRVEAGMLSAHAAGAERLTLSQLELDLAGAKARAQGALAQLAPALGLPADVVNAMDLRLDAPAAAAADTEAARRLALRNRLDVHRKLLEFGAADADVKLAVASQNPQITLGPGYAWDQGDNVWSLAAGLSLPSPAQAHALVRQNEAKRELAAQQFLATQAAAISAAEAAAAQYRLALDRVAAARGQLEIQQAQEARVVRQFDAGSADRLQRASARAASLAGEEAVQAAQAGAMRALATLEDALQHPLWGDFAAVPDVRTLRRDEAHAAQ
jgi:outer membrane protein TolC